MGSGIEDSSRICPLPPGSEKGLNWHLKPRSIFMAVGLSFILTSTALLSYMMQSPIITGPPDITGGDSSGSRGRVALGIPHGPIAIDGDANLADSALLEGWPGDGSPENPYIIDGLAIDLDGNSGSCVSISNTHVSFIIRNCSFTGASGEELWHGFGAGIFLRDVTNGELAKNILYGNRFGIGLWLSESNTVANNTCDDNTEHGIFLLE
ncbi:MAG: right-handed parallel beta-helix repeat-containing protein, partial [Promethearchaeota archaeon]